MKNSKKIKYFGPKTLGKSKRVFDIITVGSAVVDAFVDTGIPQKGNNLVYPVGDKIVVENIWFGTGGGGTNTASAFSKLGMKTGFLGKLGEDNNANMIRDILLKSKVKFVGVRGKAPTGFSVVLDSKERNRTILTYKGANEDFGFNELHLERLKTKWFYFSSMIGRAFKMQEKLAAWANRKGIMVAYNPSSYITEDGVSGLRRILRHVDVLVLNKEEARHLIPKGDLFHGLNKLGPKVVCITYGKDGNGVCDRSFVYNSLPRKIKVVERTGAGDAFAAGFVAGWIKTNDVRKAMQIGSINAESVIQKPGAKEGLMNWSEINREIKNRPIKILEKSC
jgi:ribokinase